MKRLFSLLIALSTSLTLLNPGLVYADEPPDEISETEYAQNKAVFRSTTIFPLTRNSSGSRTLSADIHTRTLAKPNTDGC